jgi:tetratricopeptide (TPR) repeat protein
MARDAVDRLFTQVSQSPKLKARGMEKFRKDLLQNAKEFYERFVQEQFDAPGVRYDLGLAYHRLGEIDRQLGDYPAAEESLTKAITVLDELVRAQPDVAEFQRDLAASYAGLGRVHSDTANWEKADTTFQQALAIQEKLVAAHPEAPEYRFALAKTYFEIVLVRRGEHHESALTMAQQVQDILTKLLQEYPKVSEYQVLLAEAQMILGNIYNAKGRHEKQADLANGWHEKAATAYKEAQSIYARLVHDRPEAPPEHWESLAHSHALLGITHRHLNQTEKEDEELRQALRIYEKLAQEHPDILEYAFDVGRCHNELAATANQAGRPKVELEEHVKTIAIMEELVAKGKLDARIQLLNAQVCRAAVLARQGEHARATEQAEAIVRQGELRSVHVYNVACVFSLASAAADRDSKLSSADRNQLKARYAGQAMDFLRQAVGKGYPYPRDIKEDHDLDPLRAREDFRKLVADLEAKQKE